MSREAFALFLKPTFILTIRRKPATVLTPEADGSIEAARERQTRSYVGLRRDQGIAFTGTRCTRRRVGSRHCSVCQTQGPSMQQGVDAKSLPLQQKAVRTKCNYLLMVKIVASDAWPEPKVPHGHES